MSAAEVKEITFTVLGVPQTAGSKRAFVIKPKDGSKPRAIVTDDNKKGVSWKNEIATAARRAYRGPLLDDPLRVTFRFFRPRPKGHFKSNQQLNAKGEREHSPATKPDVLKLARCAEDALTGVLFRDDALIVEEFLFKAWGEPARLEVTVERLSGINESEVQTKKLW